MKYMNKGIDGNDSMKLKMNHTTNSPKDKMFNNTNNACTNSLTSSYVNVTIDLLIRVMMSF
jgi:hypothetical protein